MELVPALASQKGGRLSHRGGQVEILGPGRSAADLAPGDFILTHANHLASRLIRVAQRQRMRGPDRVFAHWSHCAIVVAPDGTLVEAETAGVRSSPLSKYADVEYHLVRLGPQVPATAREKAAAYADSKVGEPFGFADMARISLSLLTGLRLDFGRNEHLICSGLVAAALVRAGARFEMEPADMLPADLAMAYGVKPE